jgi:hypothetical protein
MAAFASGLIVLGSGAVAIATPVLTSSSTRLDVGATSVVARGVPDASTGTPIELTSGRLSLCPAVWNVRSCNSGSLATLPPSTAAQETIIRFSGTGARRIRVESAAVSGRITLRVLGYFAGTSGAPSFTFLPTAQSRNVILHVGKTGTLGFSKLPASASALAVEVQPTASSGIEHVSTATIIRGVHLTISSLAGQAAVSAAANLVTSASPTRPESIAVSTAATALRLSLAKTAAATAATSVAAKASTAQSASASAKSVPVGRPAVPVKVTTSSGPNASNTGVPAGTTLTTVNGDVYAKTPGMVISGEFIKGFVFIQAPDVTIRNSIIVGRSIATNAALVSNMSGYSNLVVEDSELYAAYPSVWIKGIVASNVTVLRDNIHDVTDQVHIVGNDVTVQSSWLHSNLHYAVDPNNGNGPTHDDNIQIQAGVNMHFVGNRLEGAHNSVMQVTQDTGVVGNILFSGNYADGGNCTLNILEKTHGPVHGVVISNNIFGTDTAFANCAIGTVSTTAGLLSTSNDKMTTGAVANVRVFCPDMLRLCEAIPTK